MGLNGCKGMALDAASPGTDRETLAGVEVSSVVRSRIGLVVLVVRVGVLASMCIRAFHMLESTFKGAIARAGRPKHAADPHGDLCAR